MSESEIVEVKCSLFEWVSKENSGTGEWVSLDGGISNVIIFHDESKETFRIVARGLNQQYVLNQWIKKDSELMKLGPKFFNLKLSTSSSNNAGAKIYGLNFSDEMMSIEFSVNLENCIEILKLKDGLINSVTAVSPVSSEVGAFSPGRPLELPVNVPLPPPILSIPSANDTSGIVRSSSDLNLEASLQHQSSSKTGINMSSKNKFEVPKKSSLTVKDLREKYKSFRVKSSILKETGRNAKISAGKNISLNNIAKSFEDEATQLVRHANETVLNVRVSPMQLSDSLKRINEMLQMVLILTHKTDFSVLIHKMSESYTEFIATHSSYQGQIDKYTLDAADGRALKLVKASLIKKIHNELNGVRNLSIQMTCIITFIANIDIDHVAMIQLFGTIKSFYVAVQRLFDAVWTLKEVEQKETQSGSRHFIERALSFDSTQSNLWSETVNIEDLEQNKEEIRLGNLNQLIRKLTSDTNYDNKFLRTFTTTYQSFTTPWIFFEKLKQCYNVPEHFSKDKANQLRLKVVIVLKYWVENQLDDFDDDLVIRLQEFIKNNLAQQKGLARVADSLLKYLEEKIQSRENSTVLWFQEPERVEFPEEGLCLSDLFLEVPAQVIADQLTLIDFEIFSQFEAFELLNQSWNKPKLKHRSPNIVAVINRSTRESYWVATMILSQDNKQYRMRMVDKMIDIGRCLEKANNFNTLMGIVAGLNLAAVHRLKSIKETSKLETLRRLEKLMNLDGNHAAYRKALAASSPPCLPSLGVHLTDLVFLEDGNPDTVNDLINFKKRDLIFETVLTLQTYKLNPYKLDIVEPIYTFLQELPALDDKEMFQVSTFLEPKQKGKAK